MLINGKILFVGEISTHFLLHGFIIMLEILKSAKWCDLYTKTEIIQLLALASKCLVKKLEF